ncbi:MAG: CotH kinase family protein [Erysipelotrichales bacterium]|nr:CotH kinase family protein [Erysipelotrichales bacterium]
MKNRVLKILVGLLPLVSITACGNEVSLGSMENSIGHANSSSISDNFDGSVNDGSNNSASSVTDFSKSEIIINEVCSKNRYSFLDTYGEDSDWIELYNNSSHSINLNGWGLSNNKNNLYLFTFGEFIIESNDYIVVVASGRDTQINKNESHLPFTLSQKNGGTIYLSNNKEIVSQINFPGLKNDISYGLLDGVYKMIYPTPGEANKEEYIEKQILEMPTFSKPSGLYNDEFDLEIRSKKGYKVYYSLDSSTPTTDSNLYSEPIHIYDKTPEDNILSARTDITASHTPYIPNYPVNKCMIIRAICFDDDGNYSAVASASYWINQNDFFEDNISIMSISTDFDNLFGYEEGIYCNGKVYDDWVNGKDYDPNVEWFGQPANFRQEGFNWERIGNVSYIDENGEDVCDQTIGIRIKGSGTRGLAKKSFNIYSRYTYDGNNKFIYKFNGKQCEKLAVKSGGNNYDFPLTDSINSTVAKENKLNFDTQDATPTYLFLNGEFWGIYYLTDCYDSRYIEGKYNIDNSIVFKNWQVEDGYKSDSEKVQLLQQCLKLDMTISSNYETFKRTIDIDSFIDYIIFYLYIDTYDFSLFSANCGYWMSRTINKNIDKCDGLVRFMLYDTDLACGAYYMYTVDHNPFSKDYINDQLSQLMKNSEFFTKMYNRAKEICECLSSKETITLIENYYKSNDKLIRQSNVRYHGREEAGQTGYYNTLIDWYKNRPQYLLSFLESKDFL